MSYCVNCGVELGDSEKQCPLCGVKVVNPAQQPCEAEQKYPKRIEKIESAIDRQFTVKIISIFLAVPALICLACNILYDGRVSWSFYPIGGLVVVWAFCVSPLLFKRPAAIKWILIDIAAASAYLYLMEQFTNSGGWFLPLALPIVLTVGLMALLITVMIQYQTLRGLYIVSAVFFAISLLMLEVEALLDSYLAHELHLLWSWFVGIACVAVALTFIFIERKIKLKEELKRRLHI